MTTRNTYKRLDIISPPPTGDGGDMIQDNFTIVDDVIAAIPDGGTAGQVLAKASGTDYDTEWTDASAAPDMSGYATTTALTNGLAGKANSTHTHAYSAITGTPTIPTVPENVSAFTNDAGYLTEHQSLTNYATTAELATKAAATHTHATSAITDLTATLAGYVEEPATDGTNGQVLTTNGAGGRSWTTVAGGDGGTTYTAGSGISISGNIISVTNGTYAPANHTHTAASVSGLATVATTGNYNDLTGRPAIPAAYTLPTATTTTLGGVKVGSNLTITGGVLSATNTTYNAATTTTAGLMTAADKTKLNGVATGANNYTLPTATNSVLGGVKVGSGLTITNGVLSTTGGTGGTTTAALSGLTDVVLSNPASGQALTYNGSVWVNSTLSGGAGGSNITPCSEIFTYWDDNIGVQCTTSNSTPYPAEVAHKAGYANCSAWANGAGYASVAYSANYADGADTAMTAYYISGAVASAQTAEYAIWAGPCYGEYTNGNVAYYDSKASVYESNGSDTGSLITICPLPPLGPFMVHVMIAFTGRDGARTIAVYVCGDNLQITAVNYISGDTGGTIGALLMVSGFDISDSTLRIDRSCFHDGCNPYMNASQLLTTATVCGRIGFNNIYYSSSCCS